MQLHILLLMLVPLSEFLLRTAVDYYACDFSFCMCSSVECCSGVIVFTSVNNNEGSVQPELCI